MRIQLLLLIALLVASPCAAQSRVYTNADLGHRLSPATDTSPEAAAALLAPHQFVYVAPAPGPQIVIVGGPPADGPFGAFVPFPPSIPLEWSMSTYVGHGYGHGHDHWAGPIRAHRPAPAAGQYRGAARYSG